MSKNKDVTISATSTKSKVVQVIIYVFLTLLAVIYIAPLLWVVITSLKDDSTLMLSPWAMEEQHLTHLLYVQ